MHVFLILSKWIVPPRCYGPIQASRAITASAKRHPFVNQNHGWRPDAFCRDLSIMPSPVQYELTAAQVTRRVAQEVRTAIQTGNVSGALVIVNSVLGSPLDHKVMAFRPPSSSPSIMIERPLPSRLVSHCLVHALMRAGYNVQSSTELQKMMDLGIRFHYKTLKSTIELLCSPETHDNDMVDFSTGGVYETQPSPEDSPIGHMLSSQSSHLPPKTLLAVNILSTARQRRHHRTEDMYDRLIDACLLQGEIIIATLLFVLLVKDWQLRRVLSPSLIRDAALAESRFGDNATREQKRPEKSINGSSQNPAETHIRCTSTRKRFQDLGFPATSYARKSGLLDPSFRIPCPEKRLLEPIIRSINYHVLSRDSADETRLKSIDSMTILAAVIADRSISLRKMAPIIRCLQNCPSSPAHITTTQAFDGGWREINAYDEVHKTLVELCYNPPGDGPNRIYAKSTNSNLQLLPRLDLAAYNSLIHYALRHRMSPALANKIIEHMVDGKTGVKPDIVTYNILLRSASLLTRNDIASDVLRELSKQPQNWGGIINTLPFDQTQNPIYDLPTRGKRKRYKLKYPLRLDFVHEELTIPTTTGNIKQLKVNEYTLSSYITHMVSSGQLDAVIQLVNQLLPSVSPRDTLNMEQELSNDRQLQLHRETVQRAVEYGPYILSAILNALCKAGKTGLAERVWKVAREAEEASWRENNNSSVKHSPWCLPIQAYTSMLQCYADESKKGLTRISRGPGDQYTSLTLTDLASQRAYDRRKIHVRGWAGHILRARNQEGETHNSRPLRVEISRIAAWQLVNEMRDAAATVWEEFMRVFTHEHLKDVSQAWALRLHAVEFPTPDARFFNVLLRIFGDTPNGSLRRKRQSHSRGRRVLRIARDRFTRDGELFPIHDTTLMEVVRLMAQFGYELPLGLRRILVGRPPIVVHHGMPKACKVHPWAFPKVDNGAGESRRRPFSLKFFKTRGLPVQRISKRRMALRSLKSSCSSDAPKGNSQLKTNGTAVSGVR